MSYPDRAEPYDYPAPLIKQALTPRWLALALVLPAVVLVIVVSHVCSAHTPPPPPGLTLDGTVIRAKDGDTLVVRSCIEYDLRLIDCWAPESRTKDLEEKKRGLIAKARMTELCQGKPVRVHIPQNGDNIGDVISLGRVLGKAWLIGPDGKPEDRDLSAVMVAEGFATEGKE